MADATDTSTTGVTREVTFTDDDFDTLRDVLRAALDAGQLYEENIAMLEHMGYAVFRTPPRTPTSRPRFTLEPLADHDQESV